VRIALGSIGLGVALLAPASLAAQSPAAAAPAAAPPPSEQIVAAVLPLPPDQRASARVLGYRPGTPGLVTLREGTGPFICLASDPSVARFHVACYHRSLEPFMARGRALRAQGTAADQVDTVRYAEVRAGTLAMPAHPAALYSLTGPAGAFDPATGSAPAARPLFVVYMAGATAESTGLSPRPVPGTGAPWLMYPGTPKAHIMFTPRM
jgi:hypothetical protein